MSTDEHVSAARRRRRQPVFDFFRTRHHPLAQSRWQGTSYSQLTLKPGRQLISLSQSRWQMVVAIMIVIPVAHVVAVVVAVIVPSTRATPDSARLIASTNPPLHRSACHLVFMRPPFADSSSMELCVKGAPGADKLPMNLTARLNFRVVIRCAISLQECPPPPHMLYTRFANVLLLRTLQGENRNSETGVHQVSASQRAKKVPH